MNIAQGIVMVPIRGLAEKLGYEVTWNNGLKSVTIDNSIFFKIGIDRYGK